MSGALFFVVAMLAAPVATLPHDRIRRWPFQAIYDLFSFRLLWCLAVSGFFILALQASPLQILGLGAR